MKRINVFIPEEISSHKSTKDVMTMRVEHFHGNKRKQTNQQQQQQKKEIRTPVMRVPLLSKKNQQQHIW